MYMKHLKAISTKGPSPGELSVIADHSSAPHGKARVFNGNISGKLDGAAITQRRGSSQAPGWVKRGHFCGVDKHLQSKARGGTSPLPGSRASRHAHGRAPCLARGEWRCARLLQPFSTTSFGIPIKQRRTCLGNLSEEHRKVPPPH